MSPKKTAKTAARKQAAKKADVYANISKPARDYWEQLTWGDISDSFGDRSTQRGRAYAQGGHVKSLWATDDGRHLLAVVRGTEEYKTVVTLKDGRRKNQFDIISRCSCPVGSQCKHGVAAIAKFLELLAVDTPIPLCVKHDEETWATVSPDGTRKVFKTIFDDDEDWDDDEEDDWDDNHGNWDEDDWDDEEDDDLPPRSTRKAATKKTVSKKDDFTKSLEKKLAAKSPKELVALLLELTEEYENIRERFEQEAFAESVAKSGDVAKLVEKAIKSIDKAFGGLSYGYRGRYYDDSPSPDLDSVLEIVKQFKKFDDCLAAADRVARHLIKVGGRYVEDFQAEDTCEIDDVFEELAESLINSKTPPVDVILWAYEISGLGDYDLSESGVRTILERPWPVKIWSGVADSLIAKMHEKGTSRSDLRTIVEVLDKAHRQKEATDLLRKEAAKANECGFLADRLIEFGFLDEAETIVREQRKAGSKDEEARLDDYWVDRLKKIAEKRKDWPTLASIQAAEFFERPWRYEIKPLIATVKKAKVEPAIRKSIEEFLKTGKLPAAVSAVLSGRKPTPTMKKAWPIPVFAFDPKERDPGPRFDVLCEWAIDERRPTDVIRWLDESSKHKTKRRDLNQKEVADAVTETHPDRAFELYRNVAEHEMEVRRNYPEAIKILRKARKALEKAKRGGEWPKVVEEIRTTHRRKSSLMKLIAEMEAGSIVKQKRQGR